jgi:SAM-dependent methyltransferase
VVFGQIAKSRVPLFLSEKEALKILAASIRQNTQFLDIGAGTGRVLAYLSQTRPDIQLHGVELACLPWLYGRMTLGRQIDWQRDDYQNIDFSQFDYIYAYLSPAVMSEVWEKARREMKPGSRLISNSFAIDGQTPIEVLPLNDWKNGKLLIWQM